MKIALIVGMIVLGTIVASAFIFYGDLYEVASISQSQMLENDADKLTNLSETVTRSSSSKPWIIVMLLAISAFIIILILNNNL